MTQQHHALSLLSTGSKFVYRLVISPTTRGNKMTRKAESVKRGCGIDIDSLKLWVTIFIVYQTRKRREETKEFDNTVEGIGQLIRWLKRNKITHVAFESTGYYWQMLHSFLEKKFIVIVANPAHTKPYKGKKTDRIDSKTLAKLLRNGAIQPSFILPHKFRELRILARQYWNLTHDMVRVKNRITQTLWHACIPLDRCMREKFGVSGEAMIQALLDGVPGEEAAKLAKGKLKRKMPEIAGILRFPLSEHSRTVLARYWRQYLMLKEEIADLGRHLDKATQPYQTVIKRLCTIPGIKKRLAQCIISEIGIDMSRFPSAKHLASWSRICPGNNSSAGKRKSGRNSKGNKHLKSYLVLAAWGCVAKRGCGLRDLYYRRCARLGKKKAIVSVAHKLLRIIYRMLSDEIDYNNAYGEERFPRLLGAHIRNKLKHFNNEDLVQELLSRGVAKIEWSWEYEDLGVGT